MPHHSTATTNKRYNNHDYKTGSTKAIIHVLLCPLKLLQENSISPVHRNEFCGVANKSKSNLPFYFLVGTWLTQLRQYYLVMVIALSLMVS